MTSKLGNNTSLGPVALRVADLDSQVKFYQQKLGLTLRGSDASSASLGTPSRELLRLSLQPGAKRARHTAGLYHFCLRVEKRPELGLLLQNLLETQAELDGLVDHRMAEAIYLKDPEGNGIELNWDRPRSEWRPWSEWLSMGNAPLDVEGLLEEAEKSGRKFESIEPQARIGHIHLHVGDLEASEKFYAGVVGFDITTRIPGQATFSSAGGYHHHVAFNLWAGRNAPPPPSDAQGLIEFTVLLDGPEELQKLRERAVAAKWPLTEIPGGLLLKDPSQHQLRFIVDEPIFK